MVSETCTLGVDIGATKVAAGLVDSAGEILYQTRVPMAGQEDAAAGFRAVESAIRAVFTERPEETAAGRLAGIGVCSPGPLDPRSGIVLNPPNLPCWRNYPLAAELHRAFRLPVHLDNDANAAGLAEAVWGEAKGFRYVFYATLGTGIGTGIVFDRQIYHGRTGSAAEGGHTTIDFRGPQCACGKRGCIEALASGPAIAARARQRLAEPRPAKSKMAELAGGDPAHLTAEIVGEAFRKGDALASEVLLETAELLAVWLGNVIDLLEPEVIVFGGGVAALMSGFLGHMRAQLPRWSINPRAQEIPLLLGRYAADAGIAGAAALCQNAPVV
jgi:glucokinase